MELMNGQTVWIAFACGHSSLDGRPHANVDRGVVIDADHRLVKRQSGYVGICHRGGVEHCHPTEAEAWAANAEMLERYIVDVEKKAVECRRKARVEVAA